MGLLAVCWKFWANIIYYFYSNPSSSSPCCGAGGCGKSDSVDKTISFFSSSLSNDDGRKVVQ